MIRVLIAEDDDSLREMITEFLSMKYDCIAARDGVDALEIIENGEVDILLADIMMPRMDGIELVKNVRSMGLSVPIILATAKESLEDKRIGFSVGADDYVTKPFDLEELDYRISALIRRAKIAGDKAIEIGDFMLNSTTFEVMYKGEPIEMTKKEFELTFKLLSYPNRLFSKGKLMTEIWGYDSPSDDTTIRTHINRIRNKLEKVTEFEIKTIKGLGYKAVIKK